MKGLIFNIQRYCIHDGEGIRTVIFFKGCPLHCPWCSNPESQNFEIEKAKLEAKCIHCQKCCNDVDECPSGAIVEFGKYMTVEEVLEEVLKDSVFYNTSGGGVTLSGGEVLSQAYFAIELLKRLKSLGINTAIETCGEGSTEHLKEMAKYLDLILFDLKLMNIHKSKSILGADIELIKKNLLQLVQLNKKVVPRIPLIPGYTLEDNNINEIIKFLKQLNLTEIHILPFHQYGSNKYEFLNKKYILKGVTPPSEAAINKVKQQMEAEGLKVVVGGL
ncbi:MAG: [formate-C-acetyltransferase]-activating enzyme [Bacillota bacterium]|nr:[formate-C-acetyltransferase]-activating enzyme [Bacillota bacterium]